MSMRVPVAEKPYVAAFLIEQRTAKGWTQAQAIEHLVAARIGVKAGSYPAWETGKRRPAAGLLARIAGFYQVPVPEPPAVEERLSDMERLIRSNVELAAQIKRVMNYLLGGEPVQSERGAPSADPAAQLPRLARLSAMSALGTLRLAAEQAQQAEDERGE